MKKTHLVCSCFCYGFSPLGNNQRNPFPLPIRVEDKGKKLAKFERVVNAAIDKYYKAMQHLCVENKYPSDCNLNNIGR